MGPAPRHNATLQQLRAGPEPPAQREAAVRASTRRPPPEPPHEHTARSPPRTGAWAKRGQAGPRREAVLRTRTEAAASLEHKPLKSGARPPPDEPGLSPAPARGRRPLPPQALSQPRPVPAQPCRLTRPPAPGAGRAAPHSSYWATPRSQRPPRRRLHRPVVSSAG